MIYTIGHSTLSADAFLQLLRAHDVRQIADIRTVPRSRRHPQFSQAELAAFLERHGVAYRHFPELGGLRTPRADSVNMAWRVPGFRGYADYMQTAPFHAGLASLLHFAAADHTSVMCAESVWWRCHRRLLADALLVRGVLVLHIVSTALPKPHELSQFAHIDAGRLTYPDLLSS